MSDKKTNRISKKLIQHLCGAIILIVGVILILKWWVFLVVLCKGASGVVLALIGLIILYLAKE